MLFRQNHPKSAYTKVARSFTLSLQYKLLHNKIKPHIIQLMSTIFLLLILALLHTASPQFNYVSSKIFSSHQLLVTNTNVPGNDLTNADNGTTITLSLDGVYDSVNHHAIAFSGFSNPSLSAEMAFDLVVVSSTSTQYIFSLIIQGSTAVRQLNFALLLIGNQGFGQVEAYTLVYLTNPYHPSATISSPGLSYTTIIPSPIVIFMCGSFRGNQIGGLNKFNIDFAISGITGQTVSYSYDVGGGLNLSRLSSVMLIYDASSPIAAPPNVLYYNYILTSFSQTINQIQTNSPPNAYPDGYDRKCMVALTTFSVNLGGSLLLDLNYPSPNLNFSDSGVNHYSTAVMCYLQQFNCQLIDPLCLECSSQSTCTLCPGQHYVQVNSLSSSSCVLCLTSIPNCLTCTTASGTLECSTCQGSYQKVPGGCTDIPGCSSTDPVTQFCLSCGATFSGVKDNHQCQCSGRIVNNICSTVPGATTAYVQNDGSIIFLFCSVTLNFEAFPVNNKCVCKQKYQLVGDRCQNICGDGFNMGQAQCDDGNTVDGDGCSSNCLVEVHYRCTKGDEYSSSVCTYVGNLLTLTLKSIRRNEDLNQGFFSFMVYPPLININKMELSSYIQLDCTVNQTVESITYDYTGKLDLTVGFSTDLEGMPCVLNFLFFTAIIQSPNITLNFDAVSQTLPLRIVQHENQLKTVKTIFDVISYIGIGIFFLSLGHKMIGVEIITNLQFVYLSNVLYDKFYFYFNQVRKFEPVTGYWSLFHQENDNSFIPSFSQRVDLTPFFLQNSLLIVVVLVAAITLFLVLKYFLYKKTIQITEVEKVDKMQEALPAELIRLGFIIRAIYKAVLFPLCAGFILVLTLSIHIQCLRLQNIRSPTIPLILSSIFMLFVCLIFSNVFSAEVFGKKSQFTGLSGAKTWYIPVFILRSLVMTILLSLGVTFQYNILVYFIVLVQGAYLLLLMIFGRPYRRAFDNVGVILIEATTLYGLSLPLVMRFLTVSELYELFIVFILQGMLLIIITLSIIRLLIHYVKIVKNYICPRSKVKVNEVDKEKKSKPQLKQKQDPQIEKEQVKEMQKINPYSLYHQGFPKSFNIMNGGRKPARFRGKVDIGGQRAVKEEVGNEEDSELAACKQRLREALLRKRVKEHQF